MGTERTASPALEAFIDKTIELAKGRGYNPTTFIGMTRSGDRPSVGVVKSLALKGAGRPGGGWSNLWGILSTDRWAWFIRAKAGIKYKKPTSVVETYKTTYRHKADI